MTLSLFKHSPPKSSNNYQKFQNPNFKNLTNSSKLTINFKNPQMVINQNPNLPQHLLISEILIKLPIKSLIRFKSVCKTWHSIISNPNFAKFHLGHSKFDPFQIGHQRNLFINSNGSSNLLSIDEKEVLDSIKINNLVPSSGFRVVGSCNGLVCFYFKQSNCFKIWNPCVNEYIHVDFPQCVCFNAGFGYVSGVDDYKIFAIGLSSEPRERLGFVYSLRTNKWDKIDGHVHELVGYGMDGVLVDETLYWASRKIVGFSLRECRFHEVPRTQLGSSFLCMGLCSLDGSLCAWDYEREGLAEVDGLEIGMFKYQLSAKCWTKLFKFDVSSLGLYVRGFFGFTASGNVLVQRNHEMEVELFVCCPNQSSPNFVSLVQGTGYVVGFKESLISPYYLQNREKDEEGGVAVC